MFLYTWSFLNKLEQEETKVAWKRVYRWFAIVSIALLPLGFYSTVIAWMIFYGRYDYYFAHLKISEAEHYARISDGLDKAIDTF